MHCRLFAGCILAEAFFEKRGQIVFHKPMYGATIAPACEYCAWGRRASDPRMILCEKCGIVSPCAEAAAEATCFFAGGLFAGLKKPVLPSGLRQIFQIRLHLFFGYCII